MENEEIIEINEDIEPTPEPFVIPNIYKYSEVTKEYTGSQQADKNPAETKAQGHFVPLVPANATLLQPPECEENQVQVYSKCIETHTEEYEEQVYDEDGNPVYDEEGNPVTETKTREVTEIIENWDIKPDYRKNFLKADNELNVYPIDTIGEQEGFIVVDKELGEDIKVNKDWYKITEGEIVKKSEEEYEEEQSEKREAEFNKAFFNTSLGYVRRSVTMADGSHKDFLSDLLPVISMSVQSGQAVNILTYDKPPFDKAITDWTEYQKQVTVTAQFVQECFMQLSNDFLPINEE